MSWGAGIYGGGGTIVADVFATGVVVIWSVASMSALTVAVSMMRHLWQQPYHPQNLVTTDLILYK